MIEPKQKFEIVLALDQETTYPEEEDLPEMSYSCSVEHLIIEVVSIEEGKRIFQVAKKLVEEELAKTRAVARI